MKKILSNIYMTLIFIFLYAPIVVMMVFSFNSSKSRVKWDGFSLKWYESLFEDEEIFSALVLSLEVAVIAAIFATIIGLIGAIGIFHLNKRLKNTMMTLNSIPMVNPEIVTGVSLMLLFVALCKALGFMEMGFTTLVFAHIMFCVPYVVLSIMPKLRQMNPHLYEAAQDLGCPPLKAFTKVVLPEIMPGVVTGMMMAFTLSLDDFIISYFVGGETQTLPVLIFSMTKKHVKPNMFALTSLFFIVILVLLVTVNVRQMKDESKKRAF
ncbi:MAG: ABC transporter permease [Clostridia bacterium]|nr:ABC transporter permease [Clostridia bacterium]